MAAEAPITRDHRLYLDTDRKLQFIPYDELPTQTSAGTIRDVTGKALAWILAASKGAAPAVSKTIGSGVEIVGTFNADPALNTQIVEVTLGDDDTAALAPGRYWHQLWCTTPGEQDVYAEGPVDLLEPVHVPA